MSHGHSTMAGLKEKVQGEMEQAAGTVMCSRDMKARGRQHELEGEAEVHFAKAEKAAQHGHRHKAEEEQRKANEKLSQIPGAHITYPGQQVGGRHGVVGAATADQYGHGYTHQQPGVMGHAGATRMGGPGPLTGAAPYPPQSGGYATQDATQQGYPGVGAGGHHGLGHHDHHGHHHHGAQAYMGGEGTYDAAGNLISGGRHL